MPALIPYCVLPRGRAAGQIIGRLIVRAREEDGASRRSSGYKETVYFHAVSIGIITSRTAYPKLSVLVSNFAGVSLGMGRYCCSRAFFATDGSLKQSSGQHGD